MLSKFSILVVCAGLYSGAMRAQPAESRVKIEKEPSWVEHTDADPSYTVPDKDIDGGYLELLLDNQENLREEVFFGHYKRKIISDEGVQNASEISVSFDPSYEKLVFHKVEVLRNGVSVNRLNIKDFKVVQDEKELDRFIYNGRLTAYLFLDDIRKGDIIEYSYSLKGYNPIFNHKYSSKYYLDGTIPFGKISYRLIVPAGRTVNIRQFNTTLAPKVSMHGQDREYSWMREKIPALAGNDNIPSWYVPYAMVQVSEFGSWEEVIHWASGLFSASAGISPQMHAEIDRVKKIPAPLDQATELIRFVQDKVRYLGIEMGESSHRPNLPSKVFAQRFGDCKDKSFLLCRLLKEIGVEAHPVLISTFLEDKLSTYLPAPDLFNHAVVQIRYEGKTFWVDPTISCQRGRLGSIYFPGYKKGLVLGENEKDLTDIPAHDAGKVAMREEFTVHDSLSPVQLMVHSTFTGASANHIRSYLASSSMTETEKSYLNFYATMYPRIKSISRLEQVDDSVENVLITKEYYEIEDFWVKDSVSGKRTCSFYPQNLRNHITKPAESIRQMPFSLNYPSELVQQIVINTPEKWNIQPGRKSIADKHFAFSYSISADSLKIILDYKFRLLADHVKKEDIRSYIKNADQVLDNLGYSLSWGRPQVAPAVALNWMMIFLALVFAGVCGYAGYRLYSYEVIPGQLHPVEPRPLGSWLILIVISLFLRPLLLFKEILAYTYFDLSTWNSISDPASASYNAWLAPGVILEMFSNIILLVFSALLFLLFIRRRSNVPRLIITYCNINVGFQLLDYLLSMKFKAAGEPADASKAMALFQAIFASAVWIPYFMYSVRVRETFLFSGNGEVYQAEPEEAPGEEEITQDPETRELAG